MPAKIISGKDVAKPINEDVRRRATDLRANGWTPRLASLDITDNFGSELYIRNQRRLAESVGIEFVNRDFDSSITQREMLAAIQALNANPKITGIILQRPAPSHLDLQALQSAISPSKDVEGMHPSNIGKVVYDDFVLGPCTSLASVELLKSTGKSLVGLEVAVVGHSEIVGKPIALHLMADLATVTICHHETVDLKFHTKRADAVFVAVGKPGLISADMIKPGAVVIDIGINQTGALDDDGNPIFKKDGSPKMKTVGDVDYASVAEVAGWITPVPGGVGPVTLAMLMRNTIAATEMQKRIYEQLMAQ